mmetsp:Transcript_78576/g.228065  ORF Transcript_78576/g.228065 Transcript_78576/m.228065 type:complete len:261 (+) Transcript_78576:629-1411(+)
MQPKSPTPLLAILTPRQQHPAMARVPRQHAKAPLRVLRRPRQHRLPMPRPWTHQPSKQPLRALRNHHPTQMRRPPRALSSRDKAPRQPLRQVRRLRRRRSPTPRNRHRMRRWIRRPRPPALQRRILQPGFRQTRGRRPHTPARGYRRLPRRSRQQRRMARTLGLLHPQAMPRRHRLFLLRVLRRMRLQRWCLLSRRARGERRLLPRTLPPRSRMRTLQPHLPQPLTHPKPTPEKSNQWLEKMWVGARRLPFRRWPPWMWR